MLLTWSTSFEIDNEGFVILRSESPNGPFTPITQGMIPAMGGAGKATYTFTDGSIEQGKTYYYRLQDIDNKGRVTAHQVIPVTVTLAGGSGSSQESVGQKDSTARVLQQPETGSDKDTVQNEMHQPGNSQTWLSVVMLDNADKSSVIKTDPAMSPIEGDKNNPPSNNPPSPPFRKGGKLGFEMPFSDAEETTGDIEAHRQPIIESQGNEVEPRNLSSVTSTFSVSIEDVNGNILRISRMEGGAGTGAEVLADRPESLSLLIGEVIAPKNGDAAVIYEIIRVSVNFQFVHDKLIFFSQK